MNLLKWIGVLLFTQCFLYKGTAFGPSIQIGFTLTPDRFIFISILLLVIWNITWGTLQLSRPGMVGIVMVFFTLVCTVSAVTTGRGYDVYYLLVDFNYIPFMVFLLALSIPHSREKLASISFIFLAIGAYLALNGIFEHFGPRALVWPQYILDPSIGVQFGRTRGSFVSSEMLGATLVVTLLFYLLYSTKAKGTKRFWACLMTLVTIVTIYGANQRAAWIGLAACLGLLTILKTQMRRVARILVAVGLLVFLSGAASHLSVWERTLFAKRQKTVHDRWVNNLTTLDMGMANPLFGIGYGNFKTTWPKYFDRHRDVYPDVKDLSDGNHNTFLGLFAEVGLVGLIPYLLIIYHMFRLGLRAYRTMTGADREFAVVFLLAALSYVIGANFSDYRHVQFSNTAMFLLFGAVARVQAEMTLRRYELAVSTPVSSSLATAHPVSPGPGTSIRAHSQ